MQSLFYYNKRFESENQHDDFFLYLFGIMFFFFPAGLVLYWLVNNVLSILQQWQITRMIEGAKVVAKR